MSSILTASNVKQKNEDRYEVIINDDQSNAIKVNGKKDEGIIVANIPIEAITRKTYMHRVNTKTA